MSLANGRVREREPGIISTRRWFSGILTRRRMASSTIDLRIARASRKPRARMFVRVAIVLAAAAIAAALALLPDPAKAAGTPVVINMADNQPFYTPAKVAIKVGDTVRWVNAGDTVHSVSTAANAQNPNDTSIPQGATAFDSEIG